MQYLAGLFDGEGCVTYSNKRVLRKGKKKAYPYWRIVLEISMTHEATIKAAHVKCLTVEPLDPGLQLHIRIYLNGDGDVVTGMLYSVQEDWCHTV